MSLGDRESVLDRVELHIRDGRVRGGLFVVALLIINLVMDGLPQVASPFALQLALVPFSLLFVLVFAWLLSVDTDWKASGFLLETRFLTSFMLIFEMLFLGLFLYETRHFAVFGYRLLAGRVVLGFVIIAVLLAGLTFASKEVSPAVRLVVYLCVYAIGQILAILSFPLNYLRSDMLPVIEGANRALLSGQNPYHSFYIADKLYDFPYLPGMLLAFAPAQALHLDLRWMAIVYIIVGMWLIYRATLPRFRTQVALLIGLFVLSPYLQYRHDLYTQGHFLSLIVVFLLMQKRLFAWSAAAFGISMVISQFSWVIFPFFLLNGLRRGGWREVGRMAVLSAAAAALLWVPFLSSGAGNIAHNAVGQWDNLARPIARPINLAFWVSYLVRPSHLKWVQLVLLTAVFGYCWLRGRCADLVDTLRWMLVALLLFILLNVLIDGYFYLMLLVPMLVYTCVANGWWTPPPSPILAGTQAESMV